MTESNDKELWDKIDTMRTQLRELWEETNIAFNRMRDEKDEDRKKDLTQAYHASIEKANAMEQEICEVLDSFQSSDPLPPVEME